MSAQNEARLQKIWAEELCEIHTQLVLKIYKGRPIEDAVGLTELIISSLMQDLKRMAAEGWPAGYGSMSDGEFTRMMGQRLSGSFDRRDARHRRVEQIKELACAGAHAPRGPGEDESA